MIAYLGLGMGGFAAEAGLAESISSKGVVMAAKSSATSTAKKSTVVAAPKTAVKKTDVKPVAKVVAKKSAVAKTVAAKPVRKAAVKKPDVKVEASLAKKTTAKKTEKPAAAAVVKRKPRKAANAVSHELRNHMVATAAYFMAEKRGFAAGCEKQDWALAEAEIDAMLAGG